MNAVDDIDPTFGHWFAGFTDGEGTFFIPKIGGNGRRGQNFCCEFAIQVRSDDVGALLAIHDALGVGRINVNSRQDGSRQQVRLTVRRKAEVAYLVEVFTRFPLRAKKKRDFEVWKQAVAEWNGDRDWTRIEAFCQQLIAGRKFVDDLHLLPYGPLLPSEERSRDTPA